MSRPNRPRKLFRILCPAGCLVPREPHGSRLPVPKYQRFYNWPRDAAGQPVADVPSGPGAVELELVVPFDAYHRRLVARGSVTALCEPYYEGREPVVADAPVPVKPPKKESK